MMCGVTGCLGAGEPYVIHTTPLKPVQPAPFLLGAVEEVDLTPPPGLPMYGFGTAGVKYAQGYWLRIKGRILVLKQGTNLVALVQLDLGAASQLLHRMITNHLAVDGFSPAQLVMATTHTHGGPGGYLSNKFYNEFVNSHPAFDLKLTKWLAARIADGVRAGVRRLVPARLAVAEEPVDDTASSNRSLPAWEANFVDGRKPEPDSVDRTLTLVRLDLKRGQTFRPAGSWVVFPVHGTSMGPLFELNHGDIHGLTARLTADALEHLYEVEGFVAATATGAEGDVGPGTAPGTHAGSDLTFHIARKISEAAVRAFKRLDGPISKEAAANVPISIAYVEASLRGAGTSQGRLCDDAALGTPQLRGSEEARGPLPDGFLSINEGAIADPRGCYGSKVRPFWGLPVIVQPRDFPDVLPFQVVALGKRDGPREYQALFASVPAEPTTELGRQIEVNVAAAAKWPGHATVLGLTNGYATYLTTGPEYLAQQYEGGATLYGGHAGLFVREQLTTLASQLVEGEISQLDVADELTFWPGAQVDLLPPKECTSKELEWVGPFVFERPVTTIRWRAGATNEFCALAHLRVECSGKLLQDEAHSAQNDDGQNFAVRRVGSTWVARWLVSGQGKHCKIVVDSDRGLLSTPEFELGVP